jgi:hypothetical protein
MGSTFYLTLNLRCEGSIVSGQPSRIDRFHGNWTPGEPPHVENFKVFLGELEITNQLSKKELSELESDYMIYHSEDEVCA